MAERNQIEKYLNTLLAVDMPNGEALTVDWEPWFQVMGLQDLRMKNTMRFTQYADAVAAAVAGQGVVIGRLPLLKTLVDFVRWLQAEGELAGGYRAVKPSKPGAA